MGIGFMRLPKLAAKGWTLPARVAHTNGILVAHFRLIPIIMEISRDPFVRRSDIFVQIRIRMLWGKRGLV